MTRKSQAKRQKKGEDQGRRQAPPAILRVADLFCGGGGSSTGIAASGLGAVVCGMDNDERVLAVYRRNHAHRSVVHDLSDVNATVRALRALDVDVVVGSPPCQDFSMAGNRKEGERADLTRKFAKTIAVLRPRAFVMENVPEVLTSEAYADALGTWRDVGYHVAAVVITACHVGVPQRRRRAIVVGTLASSAPLREFVDRVHALQDVEPTTVRMALPEVGDTYIVVGRNRRSAWVRSADRPAPTLRRNCLQAPSVETYSPREDDAGPVERASLLTAWQAGILSGFPRRYEWPEQPRLAAHVIGNAVCPPVMAWIFRNAYAALAGTQPRREDDATPLYLESHPNVHGPYPGAPRSMALLRMPRSPDVPDAAALHLAAAAIPGVWIYRTSPTLVVRYRMGDGDRAADLRAEAVARCPMRRGWVLEARQRGVQNSQSDDLYWFIPNEKTPGAPPHFFRSKINIYRAGHFEGMDVDLFDEND